MLCRKVAIVGGGPGGLMSAYSLQRLVNVPLRVTLFEASSRLGGKILTPEFTVRPVRYEAGAAEFYDYSAFDDDPLKELIAELGLPIRPMGGPAVIQQGRILANLDDIETHLGPQALDAVRAFDRLAKDRMTPAEFYYSDFPDGALRQPLPTTGETRRAHGSTTATETGRFDAWLANISEPAARHYIAQLIHSDLATEPSRTTCEYGLQNYLMNDGAYMNLYGIEGGNERLPRELAARLAADVQLEHTVESIAKEPDGRLRVTARHAGELTANDFDFVIVALPLNHLPSVSFEGERLAAAMERHRTQYDHPAHYLRITLLFERPFWRDAFTDSYWMLDQFGGCCLYDESSRDPGMREGVLGWLLAGEAAERMSALSDERLVAEALDSLPQFLAHGRSGLLEARVHRWVAAVNAIPGGVSPHPHDRRHRPEPIEHPQLFVVGDYLFDSTLNGVLDSAEYVASWIASRIEEQAAAANSTQGAL